MIAPGLISLLLVLVTSALLIASGLRKQPGIGIFASVAVIGLALWLRGEGLRTLGFGPPPSWIAAILLGLALGVLIQLLMVAVIDPLAERITGQPHDLSIVENVRGSWLAAAQWLVLVWIVVAVLEEGIYRGFLMTEIAKVTGTGLGMLALNILVSSAVFGLSHGYQGRAGMLSTGLTGILLGVLFALSGFNLWLVIFTHGFIDTAGIVLIALGWDKVIRAWVEGVRR